MKKKTFVIDDDPTLCEILTTLLDDEGYEVTTLTDGEYLERELDRVIPDLIILDYLMPGKTGADITRYIRSRKDTQTIPVIMMAANQHYKAAGQKAGVNCFLNKPFDIYELLDIVQILIEDPKAQVDY